MELLRSLDLSVRVVPSTYDEPAHGHLAPRDLAIVHAREKTREVAQQHGDALVVGADTVVDVDGVAFGKPSDARDACNMLRILSGRYHIVHTAFTVIDTLNKREDEGIESTSVRFFPLSEGEIRDYVNRGESMDKAGAYGIQGFGATLVERIDGDFYTVMGFPLGRFVRTLARMGIALHTSKETADN